MDGIHFVEQIQDLSNGSRKHEQFGSLRIARFHDAQLLCLGKRLSPVDSDHTNPGRGALQRKRQRTSNKTCSENRD